MKKIVVLSLLALCLISFKVDSTRDYADFILEKLAFYTKIDFPEKVYLQTDKSIYSLDETIWFTGYLVNGIDHKKSNKSDVLHVELINDKDSVVDHKRLFIEKINEAGDIKISKAWNPGKYLLRAYTNDMRNTETEYFFKKDIWIWSSEMNNEFNESTPKYNEINEPPNPSLNFYPEGGHLVEGVSNKVAIKLKDKGFNYNGISGVVYDSDGSKVANFNIFEYGLGLVTLKPEKGKTYYARLNIRGNEEQYLLPAVQSKGFVINAVNNGNTIIVNVSSTFKKGLKETFLVAHQRGNIVYQKFEEEAKEKYSISLQTKLLKDGVVHLTLFDSSGNPVSERLLFVQNPENNITVNIEQDKEELSQRQKLTLKLNVKDYQGNLASGNFSMAVRDLKVSSQNNNLENIKTWLLLNSDMRGEIENPTYFFESGDEIKKRYLLDIVMLTNGWRRFTWNNYLYEPVKDKKFKIEQGIFISGKTINLKRPFEPLSAATRISFVDKRPYQEFQQSNDDGSFNYGPFVFFDSIPTLIEARKTNFESEKQRDRKILILLDNSYNAPKISQRNNLERETNNDFKSMIGVTNYIEQIKWEYGDNINELDEVSITAKRKSELQKRNEEMNERTLYGEPSDRIITEDVHGAEWRSVLDLLRSKAGIQVDGNSISIRGGGTPAFYLDGMEIDSTFIPTIDGSRIAFIDILKGPDANIFANSGNGVIAIYSKTGSYIGSRNIKRSPGIIDFSSEGFYVAKEFYAPDHIHRMEEQDAKDYRTTLHWEPNIRIDNEMVEISFFTSDITSDYIIEIEGVTDSGIPVHALSTFWVN